MILPIRQNASLSYFIMMIAILSIAILSTAILSLFESFDICEKIEENKGSLKASLEKVMFSNIRIVCTHWTFY